MNYVIPSQADTDKLIQSRKYLSRATFPQKPSSSSQMTCLRSEMWALPSLLHDSNSTKSHLMKIINHSTGLAFQLWSLVLAGLLLSACGAPSWQRPLPSTGHQFVESQTSSRKHRKGSCARWFNISISGYWWSELLGR